MPPPLPIVRTGLTGLVGMAIKIIVKKSASSNETQTLPENASEKKVAKPPPAGHPGPGTITPFIDKISVVLNVPQGAEAYDIHSSIWAQLDDKEAFRRAKKWGPFQVGVRLPLQSVLKERKWPLLHYRHGGQRALQFRAEFSPVDLGPQGLGEFHAQLMSLVPDGWGYFVEHGRVTMIEVTVDLPNISVDQFHLVPKQGPSSMAWKANGQLETLVLGKAKGSQTKVYDRGKKRVALGQTWTGPPTTRVERRLRLNSPLAELGTLANPFASMQMVAIPTGPPPEEIKSAYIWTLFLDSVSVRGLSTALKLLPKGKRTMYRQWLLAHPTSWWQPADIWSKWPTVLADLEIAGAHAWH